ncbi:MAG: energy transducer TonB [Bacteroidales bacterium]|nr:energy transducer TonB [Bacteroidales bacterium]
MKCVLLPLTLGFMVYCSSGFSQITDSLPQANINEVYSEYIENQNAFTDDYQINLEEFKQAKILNDTYMSVKPVTSPDNNSLPVPKGEIVNTFRFLPQAGCWAVKYKNYYGFIPTRDIMPVQDKQESFNATPYDEAPRATNKMKLKYPEDALNKGIEGVVSLKVLIDRKGIVKNVEIVNSIPELDKAAIEAVENLKFTPGKYKGKPVDVWIRIPVTFSIEKY